MLLGNPLRARSLELHQARLDPQYTHRLLHTPGVVEVRNSRRQAADKSYIFCVFLPGGGGRGDGHDPSAPAGICVCASSRFPLHLKVCTSVSLCVLMCPQVWNRRVCWPVGGEKKDNKEPKRRGDLDLITQWLNTGQTTAR